MGRTAPNPAVACTVLTGSGYVFSGGTEKAGGRHAEIAALDCLDSYNLRSAAENKPADPPKYLAVTLEPCSVTGRTPPCTSRIVHYKETENIEIGVPDPGPAGKGHSILCQELKETRSFFTESESFRRISETFLHGFLSRITGQGPRFLFKVAVTSDGFMGHKARRIHISGRDGLAFGMDLRSKADAVLVGPGTAAIDKPGLDYRTDSFSVNEYRGYLTGVDCFCSADSGKNSAEGDLLARSMIRFASEIRRFAAHHPEYQPDRVFILGRPFDGKEEFLKKQDALSQKTGKKPVYLITEKSRKEWEFLHGSDARTTVIPDLADYSFGTELRRLLGDFGYNDVLIEGGSVLFESLRPDIKVTDIFYILQSRSVTLEQTEGRLIKIPEFIKKMKINDRIPLGEDILLSCRYVKS